MKLPRILFVDDETDLLELAATFFEDENWSIDTCSDFSRALQMIKANQYDLIISDENMPSGSGRELRSILENEINYAGKFLLITGGFDSTATQTDQNFDHIIYKPLHFQELVNQVKRLLT
jgi:DNA-binding response OmpR family regulator